MLIFQDRVVIRTPDGAETPLCPHAIDAFGFDYDVPPLIRRVPILSGDGSVFFVDASRLLLVLIC